MTRDEFRRLAETWGGDIERWPQPVRGAARALAGSAEGAAILAAERRFDQAFAEAPAVTPRRAADAAFAVMQRLAAETPHATLPRHDQSAPLRPLLAMLRRWMVPAVSLAGSALLGVSLGLHLPFLRAPEPALAIVAAAANSGAMASDWGLQ